ncbi:hypothetical protein KAU33_11410, partial [Candidatus Dependentiae bacterium]|nr:hypothetical protein [Candidatus Dependentiae bacterium]
LDIKQEDYITYYVEVFDNADLSNRGVSKTYTISFKNTKEQIEEFISEQDDIITSLEKIKEKSEAIQLELNALMRKYELQNEDKLTWSDKKKLQELLDREEELITEAAKLREQLKEAEEKFDFESDTFQDTQERLDKVKELFDQLLDEKLKEMMNKLKDMLNKSNNLDLQKKNEQLKMDSKMLQMMLDRMIKELERLKLEKTLEELLVKTDDLIKKETEIQDNIGKEKGLEKDQEKITDGIKELEEDLKESIESLKESQPEVVKDLEKTQANSDFKGMQKESKDLENSLKQNQNQKSKQQAGSMKKELERLRKNLRSDLDNLKMRGNEGKIDLINLLIRDGIENSRYLKELNQLIEDNQFNITKHSSLAKDDILNSIDILSRQLGNYLELLRELSMLTIKLDSKMSDRIRASRRSLETASVQFSFGKVSPSKMFNLQAYRGINLTILDLMKLKNEIQSCASCDSQGMEQLLKMLEKLSKKQGDLNEYLEKLAEQMKKNHKPGPSEKELFEQMQREQRAIREALEKLNKQLQEMKDKKRLLGDMDKLGDDMKDVEKKIAELDIGPDTQKKQRKILQRMLDIQKSIHRQDFEKKRKAELARQKMLDIEKLAPKLKESELFLDFESFWNENYPEIYKEYLKSYFENLNQ